ncbi:MAG TPA: alpha/beta fold hydrolase [Burkholderiaceae bacterium]|nr:alpha/beta fold hydrolase [Burkholderiaceae bacterium]
MTKIRAGDVDIAYRLENPPVDGRPWLVLSHALATDHTLWDAQAAAFARACNVVRYDLRGHGQSSAPSGEYRLEQLADDLKSVLDALRITRCHFVGISLGGMIGQMAALRFPLRFASLTLADTTSRTPAEMRPTWEQRIAAVKSERGMAAVAPSTLERWFTPAFRAREPDVVTRIGMLIRATPINGYIGCAHAVMRLNLTARLQTISCPVLVIVGEDDTGTPPIMAEEIVRTIPGARLERIQEAAHLSNIEQAGRFNAVLGDFLTQVR